MIIRLVRGHPALLALFGVLLLAACGSDQGPRVDPLAAPQVVEAPPALLYTDEGADVRVRFRRESGEPAAGLPVVVSGAGTLSGGTLTDAAGEVRGMWMPGGMPGGLGAATLTVAVEGQVARLDTEVVSREVTALTLEVPERATAGEPFHLRVTGRDGKGAPPGSGSAGGIEISGGEGGTLTLPLAPAGSEVELTLSAAGARTLRAEHSAGPSAEGTILVQADAPAELAFMDASPIGREDDMAVRTPTLYAVDRFGNVFDGEVDWTVGGRTQAWPPIATFRNGAFTPDSVQLGSGASAGAFRVFSAEGAASPFSVQASLPVLPRVGVTEVATSDLPSVAFTDAPIVFAFTATGPGGPVAFGRWRATLAGTSAGVAAAAGTSAGEAAAGVAAAGEAAMGDDIRVLDAEGRSGPIPLGALAAGAYDLRIEVDGVAFSRSFSVREPPVPSAILRVAGHDQVAVEGATLAPLRIRVLDQEGEGIAAPVSWTATGGTIAGASASDASGAAAATWTLPLEPGIHEARARVGPLEVVFTATATETPVLTGFRIVSGDGQEVDQGASAPLPLVVEARDQFGAPIAVPVQWSGSGGGQVTAVTLATSAATGRAQASWIVPSVPGAAEATATAGDRSVTFGATVLEAPFPASIAVVSGGGQAALLGQALNSPVVVEVRDQFGEPIAASVSFSGPGSFSPAAPTSSTTTGRAQTTWTLPTSPGSHTATASAGAATAAFEATALEAPFPATVEIVSGNDQRRLAGKTLEEPLVVQVRDQFGNPIGGSVSWSGPGSFAPTMSTLSGAGQANTSWTLPSAVGVHTATASIGDVSVQFSGEVTDIRRAVRVDVVSGADQAGPVGTELPLPIRLRVFDQDDDPMAGALTPSTPSGNGSFSPGGSQAAGADGYLEFRWTLGSTAGTQTASFASGEPGGAATVTAEAVVPTPEHPLAIDGQYLVQTIQTEPRDRELVADRSALFRGFLVRVNDGAFTARLRLRNSAGSVVETITLTPPATIPTGTPDRMNQGTTFQATVPASRITPGMSYILEIESDAGVMADTVAPTVVSRGSLPVRFVPIRTDSTGQVGNVNTGNLGDFLGRAEALPFRDVTGSVRAEYLYGGSPITGASSTWTPLIQEIYELRLADGSSNLYYGVPHREATSGVAGIGYVGYPVSLGIRASTAGTTQYIFNHEVGHNLNLLHAPCRISASNADPDFPYSDGSIGAHGYLQGQVLDPSTADVMGYCGTHTFGTYHWSKAINYRVPSLIAAAGEAPAYRIWGSVLDGEITLRGPYVGSDLVSGGRPDSGEGGSTIHITVRDENGGVLWSGEAPLMAFDHADGGSFSLPVPIAVIGEERRAIQVDVEARGAAPGVVPPGQRFTGTTRRSFAVGFDREVPGLTRVPEAEVYRAPDGSVMGFGMRGVTRVPAGALIQDGTPAGLVRAPGTAGQPGPVVGRARDMIRGGGGTR